MRVVNLAATAENGLHSCVRWKISQILANHLSIESELRFSLGLTKGQGRAILRDNVLKGDLRRFGTTNVLSKSR